MLKPNNRENQLNASHPKEQPPWKLALSLLGDTTLQVELSGSWRMRDRLPPADEVRRRLEKPAQISRVVFKSEHVSAWDSGLINFLRNVTRLCNERNIEVDDSGLPEGAQRLLKLAFAVPEQATGRHVEPPSVLRYVGQVALDLIRGAPAMVRFVGEVTLSVGRLLRGKAQYRRSDLALTIQETGPQALPIVSLISFLVGLILAYMGAVQLAQFGAQIYIADLVGIGMAREIGALMTGIILAGRTGAAFAAQLGTMQVNEEIDAYRTLGISPVDFLVLPRMLALILMAPLLTLYASLVGMVAGMLVAVLAFNVDLNEYYQQTLSALTMQHFLVGLSKGAVYGILIAVAGCLRGMQCGRSASAVGEATTSAVVTAIVFIVVSASLMTVMYQKLGI